MKGLYMVRAASEVLNIRTSEYRTAAKMMNISFEEYHEDPLFVSFDCFMVEDSDGFLLVVGDPGNQLPIECFWNGGDGEVYSVKPEDVEFECMIG